LVVFAHRDDAETLTWIEGEQVAVIGDEVVGAATQGSSQDGGVFRVRGDFFRGAAFDKSGAAEDSLLDEGGGGRFEAEAGGEYFFDFAEEVGRGVDPPASGTRRLDDALGGTAQKGLGDVDVGVEEDFYLP
jgi:hypothetical protein